MKNKTRHRIALTPNGVGYLGTVLVLFLFSINYNSNLLFTLCFILTGVFIVCFWLNFANIKSIKSSSISVQAVHQKQTLGYKIEVQDEGKRNHQNLFANEQAVADIKKYQAQTWQLTLSAEKRGLKESEPLRVGSRWPLGLFKSSCKIAELPSVVVYPKISDTSALKNILEGDEAHQHNDADNLVGLKEYQLGDNARRIDWRVMARREELQVKLFDGGSGDASVYLAWDDTVGIAYEQRISSLCRWILDYQKQGIEFGLKLPGFNSAPANNFAHVHQCLYQLAIMPQQETTE